MKAWKNLLFAGVSFLAATCAASADTTPLALGATVTGSIARAGQFESYTFTGSPGQRLLYDALDNDFDQIGARLIPPSRSPGGAPEHLNHNADSDVGPFTLTEAGTYTLIIDGNAAVTGDYAFRLLDVSDQTTLAFDTLISGTLDPGLSANLYRFTGAPDQRLYFDAQGPNAGGTWYLYGPNNEFIPGAGAGIGADFEVTLTQPGTYLLALFGNNANPVPFSFRAVTFDITTNPLTLGATVTGTIAEPGEQDVYTFTGAPGQRLLYDALDADFDQIYVNLRTPSGAQGPLSNNSDYDLGPVTLTEAGTYTLTIDGLAATTSDYAFRLLDVAALPALPLDTLLDGPLDPGLSITAYRHDGAPGQKLYFDGLGANAGATWYLFDPNNQSAGSAGIGADFEAVLAQTGTYVLALIGGNANAVSYSVKVVSFETPASALAFGTTVSGTIAEAGDQAIYTFTGAPGQRIYYDALDLDAEQLYARLVAPSGIDVWNQNHSYDAGPVTLLEAGIYRLIIDGYLATTGDYSFRVYDLASAPNLTLGADQSGDLTPSSETDIYQFNGTAGRKIDARRISATLSPSGWRLVDPANRNLASGGLNQDLGEIVLRLNEPHFLLLEGVREDIVNLNYTVRLSDVSGPPVAVTGLGEIVMGEIAAGQRDTRTFTAPAGTVIYFDALDGTPVDLAFELADPDGTVLFRLAPYTDSNPYWLLKSWTYSAIVRGNNAASTGNFKYRLLDLGAAPLLTFNTPIASNLDPPYRTDFYRFTGAPGQRLVYDALDNDFDTVAVRLWTPDGGVRDLNHNSDYDVGPFTLLYAGTYYLALESRLATVADYQFRLLNVADAPALPLATALDGTLDPGLAITLYRFAGAPGQHLFFDGLGAASGGNWYLYGPLNNTVSGANLVNDFEVTLAAPGYYLLALIGASASPVPYSVKVLSPAAPTDPLTLGAAVQNTLAQPGDQHLYTFTGTQGQRLIYDALDYDFDSIAVRLFPPSRGPGGVLEHLNQNADTDAGPFTLTETGTYTLVIDGNAAVTGDYAFRLLDVTSATPLTLDTTVNGTLDPGLSATLYRFTGAAGQRLYFDALGGGGGSWFLSGPNNEILFPRGIQSDFDATLNTSGTYTLALSGTSQSPVPFSFKVVTYDVSTSALTLGATVTGTLAEPGERDNHTFTGAPGQRLIYDALDADFDQVIVRLFTPSGANLFLGGNADYDVGPFTLLEAGTYTLLFEANGGITGDYSFRLLNVAALPVLALDTLVNGTLDPGYSITAYRLNGTAGQKLFFDGLGANLGADWFLFGRNNERLGGTGIGADFELTLAQAGDHVVLLSGRSASPVSYSVKVIPFTTPVVALAFGDTITGMITVPGQQDLYTFNGAQGMRLYYDALDRDFEALAVQLLSPTGVLLWNDNHSGNYGPLQLVEDGAYTLVIDGVGATLGDYRFRLYDLNAAPQAVLGATVNNQLQPGSETDFYQFTGAVGQRVSVDNISATLSSATWRLVGPASQNLLGGGLLADLGPVVLPANGPYFVLLEGVNEDIPSIAYQVRVVDSTEAPVVPAGFGSEHAGDIAAGQQTDFQFTAPAGLLIYFDSLDRTGVALIFELRDPANNVVFTASVTADSGPYVLARAGTYTGTVRGNSPPSTGSYRFRLVDVSNAPPLAFDTVVTANLDPGYKADVYRFAGATGQRLFYDALDNDNDAVAARLLAPDLALRFLNHNSDSDVGPFTLSAPGSYYLFLDGAVATPTDYKFSLLDVANQPLAQADTPIMGTFDPGLMVFLYRLPVAAGQHLYFDGGPPNGGGPWYCYGPNNEYLGGAGLNGDFELFFAQAGTCVLALYGTSTTPAAFTVQIVNPEGTALPGEQPRITEVTVAGNVVTVRWTAVIGRTYFLQFKPTLDAALWTDLGGGVVAAEGTASKTDNPGADPQRFYRVKLVP